jgi:hypothetical protein
MNDEFRVLLLNALCLLFNDSQFGSTYAGLIPLAALKQLLPISSALMDRIHGYLNQDP